MLNEIILSVIQAATEFLPVSSSGHLALYSNLFSEPDLFFITFLHLASLLAVVIFTRKELIDLLKFKKEARKLWIYLIIATIPAALVGFLFKSYIESSLSSLLFLGIAFLFTGTILIFTKFSKQYSSLNLKSSVIIGLFQAIALFPGVSRSGMTISSSLFMGIEKEKAAKFSFLLFIPLSLGAFMLEIKDYLTSSTTINIPLVTLIVSFIICASLSLLFLNLLFYIIKRDKFWMFSIYCYIAGIITIILFILGY
ncbi:undecaprenyl-diphosphate phosphatase [Candidatus Pacearchaeota archaeon]|nr:undecaprenyl-diphosphate phosphatase [Candidatus Pacearchaeota archaeon]